MGVVVPPRRRPARRSGGGLRPAARGGRRRLARAVRLLPEGLCLLVTQGYRPFVPHQPSPPETGPHVSGAAVDLTLCTAAARRNRRTLSAALTTAGLANYPPEWWHWSYGVRYWALRTGAAAALYGPADA